MSHDELDDDDIDDEQENARQEMVDCSLTQILDLTVAGGYKESTEMYVGVGDELGEKEALETEETEHDETVFEVGTVQDESECS